MDSNRILKVTRSALFLAIIVVQEFALSFIPGLQLTSLLLTLHYYLYGSKQTLFLLIPYVIIDNLLMGSLNLLYTPAMLIAWLLLIVLLKAFKTENVLAISFIVGFHGFLYSWCFVIVSCFMYQVDFMHYLLMDIPFEILMVVNGFLTTLILFNPLIKTLKKSTDKVIKNKKNC